VVEVGGETPTVRLLKRVHTGDRIPVNSPTPSMCSVAGCESGRRGARRFKLPEDPERRLEWVQFLAAVNKQRFKESSCTDITICSEHFNEACLDHRTATHPGGTGTVQLTLNPGAVPSLQPEEAEESPARVVSLHSCTHVMLIIT